MAASPDPRGGDDPAVTPASTAEGTDCEAITAARVLVIEDEPGIVDFVRRGLEAAGFAVEVAVDGIEGERLASRGGFDAVVLDLMLPGRDGMDVLTAVHK